MRNWVAYLKQIGILGKPDNIVVKVDSIVDAVPEAINESEEVESLPVFAEAESSLPVAPAENDEDSWIQAIAAETPLQDEEVLYLRTIHQLFQSTDTVRMIDVAKRLEQGTGKVSYWMKKLREKGILDTTPKGVITLLKPANTKDAVSKEEVTDRGCEAADSLGEPDRVPFISHDDVGGIKQLDEEPEKQFVVSEPVQREEMNKTAPGEKEQPIAEKQEELGGEKGFSSDAKLENANVQNKSKRVKPLDELLEVIEEIRRRYPEGTSEADMNTLKQKNKAIVLKLLI